MVANAGDAVRQIYAGSVKDAVFSSDATKVYAVSGNAVVAIDVGSGQVLATYDAGQTLGALDISADGRYLATIAYPAVAGSTPGTVFRIDTQTSTVQSFATPDGALQDVAFLDDGSALLSYRGRQFLDRIDFATGTVGGNFNAQPVDSAVLEPSADHTHVLVMGTNIGEFAYDFRSGVGIIGSTGQTITDPYAGATVPDLKVPIGTIAPSNTTIIFGHTLRDEHMTLLGSQIPTGAGIAFSPDSNTYYVAGSGSISAFDPVNWHLKGVYPINGSAYGSNSLGGPLDYTGFGDLLQVSPDGRYLSVITNQGLTVVDRDAIPAQGTPGDDVIVAGDTGTIFGYAGNDTITSGANLHTMYGGPGDDVYYVNQPGDRPLEYANEGYDTVYASSNFQLTDFFSVLNGSDYLEELIYTGTADASLGGNNHDNKVTAGPGNDSIQALGGNDQLFGLAGNDTLDGGAGADTLSGGTGNDVYYVDDTGDTIVELADGGQDTAMVTAAVYTLPDNVENIWSANSQTRTLAGNDLGNELHSGGAPDTLIGGAGSDTYYVLNRQAVVVELADGGMDTFHALGNGLTLPDNVEIMILESGVTEASGNAADNLLTRDVTSAFAVSLALHGLGGNDTITTFAGYDTLDGGTGVDSMTGGIGDDTYYVDNSGDIVVEAPGEGTDRVIASIDYTLATEFENLTLSGAGAVNGTGNAASNQLTGSDANNLLTGLEGNDTLDGGAGNDTMVGGLGDDSYVVDSAGDQIVEDVGDGKDSVRSSISYTLGANLEDLTLSGSAFSGLGNELDNLITGNAAANRLSGALGADLLTGGGGNDVFQDTGAGFNGDTITDFGVGDTIRITDAVLADFAVINTTPLPGVDLFGFIVVAPVLLTYPGGTLTLQTLQTLPFHFHLSASAAPGGGVDLKFVPDTPPLLNNGLTGDFNGDGRDDILWRSDVGQLSDWLAKSDGGFSPNDANAFAQVSTDWKVVGAGDFNGDGKDDIAWRNTATGHLSDWLGTTTGGFVGNDANALTQVDAAWKVIGTGDFNGDGKDDLLWRNDSGQLSDWLGQMNGGFSPNDANALNTVSTDWKVVGVADFDGDHRDDILWRNAATGQLSDWLAKDNGGFAPNDANAFTTVSKAWHVVGTGDFNGDGREDILWRSDTGQLSNWLGQIGGGFVGNDANAMTQVALDWQVAGVGDYNGDKRDDILWRNTTTGALSDWLGQANGGFAGNDGNALVQGVPLSWHIQAFDSFAV